jgi:Arc/MetJ-type ribon-helix-helix transcriptional regulator
MTKSRGSPVVPIRIPPDLLRRIDEAIASNNAVRPGEAYDRSEWIRKAIEERLAKQARGRRKGRGRATAAADQDGADQLDQLGGLADEVIVEDVGPGAGPVDKREADDLATHGYF